MGRTIGQAALAEQGTAATAEQERLRLWQLLAGERLAGGGRERRRMQRFAYPKLIELTPLAADGCTPAGETTIVVGRQISPRGLSFFHPAPLPHRLVRARLELSAGKNFEVLLDLTWCRFTRQRWYESGGRFVQQRPASAPRRR